MERADRPFHFFLAGQGILALGESIRFIAVTMLIYDLTGSGISAATGVALSTLPGILLSPFAGFLGDRIRNGRILILIDLARFIVTPLFLLSVRVGHVYFLLILVSLLDVFYIPSRRKFMLILTGKKDALRANSLLTGANGAAYLAGPLLTGVITDRHGYMPVFLIAAACCFAASVLTLFGLYAQGEDRRFVSNGRRGVPEVTNALNYCRRDHHVRELLRIGCIIGFCTLCVNLAFYPFAFDLLKVTAKGWGLMITIYYGTNLIAMLLVRFIAKQIEGRETGVFYFSLVLVSLIWFVYAFTGKYAIVLMLQFTEGILISGCGILLAARFQRIVSKEYMARISALNELLGSLGKLAGMGCMTMVLRSFSFREVFVLSSLIMALFAGAGLIGSNNNPDGTPHLCPFALRNRAPYRQLRSKH